MTKQEELRLREKKFLDLMADGSAVEIASLMEQLQVKRRTLEMLRNEVNEKGYCVTKAEKGKWCRKLDQENPGFWGDERQEQSLVSDAQAAVYMTKLLIEEYWMNVDNLYRSACDKNNEKYGKDKKDLKRASQSRAFMSRIDELKDAGFITVDDNDNKKINPGENAPVFIAGLSQTSFDNESESIYEIDDALNMYAGDDNEVLKHVSDKINFIFSGGDFEESNNYKKVRRWSDVSKISDLIYRRFGEADYTEKTCEITFEGRKGNSHTKNINVGLLIYSRDKNELYVLGRDVETGGIVQIRAERITGVKQLEQDNPEYCSQEFEDIFEKMFETGYSAPQDVEVYFDLHGNVEEKIKQLAKSREKTAELTKTVIEGTEKLVYKDTIIGIPDFAVYLRQFGYSCEVIKPLSLRNMMRQSAKRMLDRYRKEGICE